MAGPAAGSTPVVNDPKQTSVTYLMLASTASRITRIGGIH